MYEVSNRKCFGGPYKVPITQFNRQTWWPPKWIECDCGEHAEHIFYRKNGNPYPTKRWHCDTCHREYQIIEYTTNFILLENDSVKQTNKN
ncbi:hypothetical protein E4T76_16730 [Enterococcus gallinarum]|nr:hypothetical protein E4T76_16730 [Enterococcus gallinarum]